MSEAIKIKTRKALTQLRRCLLCGGKFASEGPHNRVCRRCKSSQMWRQG